MRDHACVVALVFVTMAGCANEVASDGEVVEPAAAVSALDQCSSDDLNELNEYAHYAYSAIVEGVGNYSSDHPVAQRYFGQAQEEWRVREIMTNMANVASGELSFSCEDESSEFCADGAVFWVWSNASQTGDRTIHLCGRRFWDSNIVTGEDRGSGVSKTGALVHEIAHLAGAFEEGTGERMVLWLANQEGGFYSFRYADAYRFFIMRQNDP